MLELLEMKKSTYYYHSSRDDTFLGEKIRDIAEKHVFYGYRRIYITLRQEGFMVNHKKFIESTLL